jgi:hypothetical protein
MQMPSADRAYVDPAKVRDYLLSPTHPDGRLKARVFAAFGYHRAKWARLHGDLEQLAIADHAEALGLTAYGRKFAIRGMLQGPNGRPLSIVTICMVRHAETFPRLVTAYPGDVL